MSADCDSDRLDSQDWRWLRANDLDRRSQRRRFDGESHTPACDSKKAPPRHSSYETALAQETHAEESVRETTQTPFLAHDWTGLSNGDERAVTPDALDSSLFDEDVAYADIDADAPDFDWQDYVLDADEFDEFPTRLELADEVRVEGRVSGRERAEQVALDLGLRYGWDNHGIQLLTDLFDVRFWGATRRAVERLLSCRMTPDELEVAIQLREFWSDRSEFSIDLGRVSWWAARGSSATASKHGVLSWPVALRLVRMATALPDVAEIERLLDELFNEWYCSDRLRFAFCSFNYFMLYWLDHMEAHPELRNMWMAGFDAIVGERDLGNEENHFPGYTTPRNQLLNRLGVLPVRIRTGLEEQLRHDSA